MLREIAITNLSHQRQCVEGDTVLGEVEYVEPRRIVEEADTVFVAAECKSGRKKNCEGKDFNSRIFKGMER